MHITECFIYVNRIQVWLRNVPHNVTLLLVFNTTFLLKPVRNMFTLPSWWECMHILHTVYISRVDKDSYRVST